MRCSMCNAPSMRRPVWISAIGLAPLIRATQKIHASRAATQQLCGTLAPAGGIPSVLPGHTAKAVPPMKRSPPHLDSTFWFGNCREPAGRHPADVRIAAVRGDPHAGDDVATGPQSRWRCPLSAFRPQWPASPAASPGYSRSGRPIASRCRRCAGAAVAPGRRSPQRSHGLSIASAGNPVRTDSRSGGRDPRSRQP